MSLTDATSTTQQTPGRVDGPVLVSNLVAGACFLVVLALLSWPLAVLGAVYVAAASVCLAAVYARPALTRRQEAAAWVVPWLVAVALWAWVGGAGTDGGTWLLNVWFGFVIATPCYLVWQTSALAVRQLLAWRANPTSA
ncbi:hypothetical protein ncot_18015 [Nocardioides sp. JQ2195]|uniref:hypothetical protein n=1 Tax=Nocardioides sp. JQ2195 TaxID=2592334 RepID=UPI00143E15CA|nr:hypothetical protein [Nocardioides sp. JQ2195]QIX28274.1 hypothetical protein ncot_18015 [Nocardioides sp. JQ2195]